LDKRRKDKLGNVAYELLLRMGGTEAPPPQAKFMELYSKYKNGEMSSRAIAKNLGISYRDLYDLMERKVLPF